MEKHEAAGTFVASFMNSPAFMSVASKARPERGRGDSIGEAVVRNMVSWSVRETIMSIAGRGFVVRLRLRIASTWVYCMAVCCWEGVDRLVALVCRLDVCS